MVCAMRDCPYLVASISLMVCAMMLSASRVSKGPDPLHQDERNLFWEDSDGWFPLPARVRG